MALNWDGWPLGAPEGVEDIPEEVPAPGAFGGPPLWDLVAKHFDPAKVELHMVLADGTELPAADLNTDPILKLLRGTFRVMVDSTSERVRLYLPGFPAIDRFFDQPIEVHAGTIMEVSLTLY